MQPTLFPWLGYFDLIDQSDMFIFYNDVQFVKRSWQSRNRISTPNGILQLTIPTVKCSQQTIIQDVYLEKENNWGKNLVKTLKHNYIKSKHYDSVINWISNFLDLEFEKLQDFNTAFIREVCNKIGIKSDFVFSSDIQLKSICRIEKFIEMTILFEDNIYLSPVGSFGYLNDENAGERFKKRNLQIMFHNYEPIKYETGKIRFEPYMSILDALFNCGFEDTLNIIRLGRKENFTYEQYQKLMKYE